VKRVTVTLTKQAIDLLESECGHRQQIEGSRVRPARIVNELIMAHLFDRNGTAAVEPRAPSKKKPQK
jgi:hypothetical protein